MARERNSLVKVPLQTKRAKRKEAEKGRQHVAMEGRQIENVYNFIYLGCKTQADGDCMVDVKHRMDIAEAAFNELSSLWSDHRLPLSMKLRLYRLAVCSTLMDVRPGNSLPRSKEC